jgi:hypothetical protein
MRNLLQRDYCLKYMNYKQGISRQQVSLMSIDCHISSDNPVRVMDMFVEQPATGIAFERLFQNQLYQKREMVAAEIV